MAFDCDGVLLNSNNLKRSAFSHCLRKYEDQPVTAFLAYQRSAFGRSRYRLFDDFFDLFLKRDPVDDERGVLLEEFARFCSDGYMFSSIADNLIEILDQLKNQSISLYVASGSDEAELRIVFEKRGLSGYFEEIFGSPTTKVDNLRKIKALHPSQSLIFFGDAKADLDAALEVGAEFIYIDGWAADPETMRALASYHSVPKYENLNFLSDYRWLDR